MEFLRGLPGLIVILLLAVALSFSRKDINKRLILGGMFLQFFIAFLIFKVPAVTVVFRSISSGVVTFLNFALDGSAFLFGGLARNSIANPEAGHSLGFLFAFQALPILIFFSAITALLYYLGILQKVVYGFAWVMKRTMRLSGSESLSAAGNVFLGQTEAPLLVRPFIGKMTMSELHCLMVGGMATIAGSVLGAYVSILGGDSQEEQVRFASYLLGASLMNAPAAIVLAKVMYPEKEEIQQEMVLSKEQNGTNVLDALTQGTTVGLKLALNVGAMLLVFVALVFALNWMLKMGPGEWFGLNIWVLKSTGGVYESFSMEYILGQIFRVFAWLTGVDWNESLMVGSLLGQKLVINEFIAYQNLGIFLEKGVLSDKAVLISTYALCGFANFSSIAIQIGGIGSMAPERQADISRLGLRSLVAATLATLMTATIAGMLN